MRSDAAPDRAIPRVRAARSKRLATDGTGARACLRRAGARRPPIPLPASRHTRGRTQARLAAAVKPLAADSTRPRVPPHVAWCPDTLAGRRLCHRHAEARPKRHLLLFLVGQRAGLHPRQKDIVLGLFFPVAPVGAALQGGQHWTPARLEGSAVAVEGPRRPGRRLEAMHANVCQSERPARAGHEDVTVVRLLLLHYLYTVAVTVSSRFRGHEAHARCRS